MQFTLDYLLSLKFTGNIHTESAANIAGRIEKGYPIKKAAPLENGTAFHALRPTHVAWQFSAENACLEARFARHAQERIQQRRAIE